MADLVLAVFFLSFTLAGVGGAVWLVLGGRSRALKALEGDPEVELASRLEALKEERTMTRVEP